MKLKLLFTGLLLTLIAMQFGWNSAEMVKVSAATGIHIEESAAAQEDVSPAIPWPSAGEQEEVGSQEIEDTEEPDAKSLQWFIGSRGVEWNAAEWELVQRILDETFKALNQVAIDGEGLLEGYQFRRISGEYVDESAGRIAVVYHDLEEIWLADAAFVRLDGFYIYHELGHAVDSRLDRQLSQAFHTRTGGKLADTGSGHEWRTADTFWMRPHGRDSREEATADAFALLVSMNQPANKYPIFSGMPTDADYSAITDAASQSLTEIAAAGSWLPTNTH